MVLTHNQVKVWPWPPWRFLKLSASKASQTERPKIGVSEALAHQRAYNSLFAVERCHLVAKISANSAEERKVREIAVPNSMVSTLDWCLLPNISADSTEIRRGKFEKFENEIFVNPSLCVAEKLLFIGEKSRRFVSWNCCLSRTVATSETLHYQEDNLVKLPAYFWPFCLWRIFNGNLKDWILTRALSLTRFSICQRCPVNSPTCQKVFERLLESLLAVP